MSRRGITQYEVDHQENLMLVDDHWPDSKREYADWDDEEVFEDDELDDF